MTTAMADPWRQAAFAVARDRSPWPNVALVVSIGGFYAAGINLLLVGHSMLTTVVAVALLSQSMIWSWYLTHDCAHRLVAQMDWMNVALAELLGLINGVAYTGFSAYRMDHMRHHAERIDLLGVDLRQAATAWPRATVAGLKAMEFTYIPIFFYVVKWRAIGDALNGRDVAGRLRALACLGVYGALFVTLSRASFTAPLALLVASFVRIHVTRFVDAFQHTYDQVPTESQFDITRSRDYEMRNTFSLPVARRHRWLNLLILNFGFHYAHHSVPSCPWYALPKVDTLVWPGDQTGDPREREISFGSLVAAYHSKRVARIFEAHEGVAYDAEDRFSLAAFTGAYTDKLLG